MANPIIQVEDVKKSFRKSDRQELLVLDEVNFSIHENEIIALLGKSGSGKSTLLRIIAGLIKPSGGEVLYHGQAVHGPVQGLTMVFQSFALLPWLTVLQNVELGLEALGVNRAERRSRALGAIDIIGLDGFESAYPKELSGGMRQRVGFARALVVNPEVLLMDEPFSALDVLTADNLRSDLLDLWQNKKIDTKCILFVTHSIEEAVLIADRIFIFSSDPGSIRSKLKVNLPRPRNEDSVEFRKMVDQVYTLMTTAKEKATIGFKAIDIGYRLPKVAISELMGLVDELNSAEYEEAVDLPELSDELNLDIDDLFPITEALELLHFAKVSSGDIELTRAGKLLTKADMLERKKIFASHLMSYVPITRHIKRMLDEAPDHRVSEDVILKDIETYLSEISAEEVLKIAIDWGRYAEIFAYDYNSGMLSLENPE